ncbi:hypothetical protein DMX04_23820 [Pseudomonas koreensis]|nr:hypothetical protein DMX04_23820 [Pseudomonas koreensis]
MSGGILSVRGTECGEEKFIVLGGGLDVFVDGNIPITRCDEARIGRALSLRVDGPRTVGSDS